MSDESLEHRVKPFSGKITDFLVKSPTIASSIISLGIPLGLATISEYFAHNQNNFDIWVVPFALTPPLYFALRKSLIEAQTMRQEGIWFDRMPKQEKKGFFQDISNLAEHLKNWEFRKFLKGSYDLPYKHPIIFGLAAPLSIVDGKLIEKALNSEPKVLAGIGMCEGLLWFGGANLLYVAGMLLQSGNIGITYQILKNNLLFKLGRKDAALVNLERYYQKNQSNKIVSALSSLYSKNNQWEKAVNISKANLDSNKAMTINSFYKKMHALTYVGAIRKLRNKKGRTNFLDYTQVSIEEARIGYPIRAKETILEGLNDSYCPSNDEIYRIEKWIFAAYVLDTIGFPDDARQKWREAVMMIREIPELQKMFERIDNYDVFRLAKGRLLENEVILKGGIRDANPLERELELSRMLLEKLRGTEFQSVEPITVFDVQDKYYLAERHAPGERLSDYVTRTGDLDAMRKAARHLGVIHSVMPANGKRHDPREKISRRLKVLPPATAQIIWDNIDFVFQKYDDYPVVFDKDGHNENFYVGEKGESISLDVEDRGVVCPQEDVARLYSIGKGWQGKFEDMETSIQQDYLDSYGNNGRTITNPEEFVFEVEKAFIPRTLAYFCFTKEACRKQERGEESIINAIRLMDFIQDKSKKIDLQTSKSITSLKNAYGSLIQAA